MNNLESFIDIQTQELLQELLDKLISEVKIKEDLDRIEGQINKLDLASKTIETKADRVKETSIEQRKLLDESNRKFDKLAKKIDSLENKLNKNMDGIDGQSKKLEVASKTIVAKANKVSETSEEQGRLSKDSNLKFDKLVKKINLLKDVFTENIKTTNNLKHNMEELRGLENNIQEIFNYFSKPWYVRLFISIASGQEDSNEE